MQSSNEFEIKLFWSDIIITTIVDHNAYVVVIPHFAFFAPNMFSKFVLTTI